MHRQRPGAQVYSHLVMVQDGGEYSVPCRCNVTPWEKPCHPLSMRLGGPLGRAGQIWRRQNLALNGVQTLDCTAHNKLQYQLHYPGIHFNYQLTS